MDCSNCLKYITLPIRLDPSTDLYCPNHRPYSWIYSISIGPDGIPPKQYVDNEDNDFLHLYCPRFTVVPPRQTIGVNTCIKLEFPINTIGLALGRLSHKQFATLHGLFTNDCSTAFVIHVHNLSNQILEINRGQFLAKMILISFEKINQPDECQRLSKLVRPEIFSQLLHFWEMKKDNQPCDNILVQPNDSDKIIEISE